MGQSHRLGVAEAARLAGLTYCQVTWLSLTRKRAPGSRRAGSSCVRICFHTCQEVEQSRETAVSRNVRKRGGHWALWQERRAGEGPEAAGAAAGEPGSAANVCAETDLRAQAR